MAGYRAQRFYDVRMTSGMANAIGVGLQHAAPGIFTTLRVRRSAQLDRDLELRGDADLQNDVLIGRDLGVTRNAGIDGTLDVGGPANFADGVQAASTLDVGGPSTFASVLRHNGTQLSFYGATPQTKPTVTGSTEANPALQNLLTFMDSLGLITDATSAGSGPTVPTVSGSRADPEQALASLLSGLASAGYIVDDTTP